MFQSARKKATDCGQRILEIFDSYVHGKMPKREFITQAGRHAATGVTGAMILEQLQPNYALAQQVAPDDPRPDGAAGRHLGPAARRSRNPREPRPEPRN